MAFLAAVALFPLLLWLLSLGAGLLCERGMGGRLPTLLVIPVGFGALIVVSQLTTWFGATAPLTPFVLVVLALTGAVLSRRDLRERWAKRPGGWWWALVPLLATYLLIAAPVIAFGHRTFTAYLLDTTGAVQLMGGEHLLQHGHRIAPGVPAYWTELQAYFGNGYPSGGQGVMASVGWLTGQDLIWLYSVFQAAELAVMAMAFASLGRSAGLGRASAAVAGTVASVPALLYAYALMGSVKEITALPMIILMGALIPWARVLARRAGPRAVLPVAIAGVAVVEAVGLAGAPWVLLLAAAALVFAITPVSARDLRRLAIGTLALGAVALLLALPVLAHLTQSLNLAKSVTNSNQLAVNDPGNLLRPLKLLQVFGVWIGESHRLEPKYLNQTNVGIGVMVLCVVLGLIWLIRRRAWAVLAFVVISFVVRMVLHTKATYWTDAKLLVILSPVVVFVGLLGGLGLMRGRRAEGLVLAIAASVAVLASDGLLYHGTNLAPTQRYEELAHVAGSQVGSGPTLINDFDEYAVYMLRDGAADGPGLPDSGPFTFVARVPQLYGHSYDLDAISLPSVERFNTIVMRRSPGWSRPPSNFRRTFRGGYYEVWKRFGPAPAAHYGLGGGWQASAVPSCRLVGSVAARARRIGGELLYAPRPLNVSADLGRAGHSPLALPGADMEGRPQFAFIGPGRVEGVVRVPSPGFYEVWLGGDVDRPVHVYIDGRQVGAPSKQSGGDQTAIHVARVYLPAGLHHYRLLRGGGSLSPDDQGSTFIDGFVLEPTAALAAPVVRVAPSAWRSLCGRPSDWLEIS